MSSDYIPPVNDDLRRALEDEVAGHIDEFRARVVALVNLIDQTANAPINANPAVYIKGLAREVVALARQTIRLAMLAADVFDDADTGVDPVDPVEP